MKVPTVDPVKVTVTVPGVPTANGKEAGDTVKFLPAALTIEHVNVVGAPAAVNTKPRLEEPVGKL